MTLCWAHMSEGMFSDIAAHLKLGTLCMLKETFLLDMVHKSFIKVLKLMIQFHSVL